MHTFSQTSREFSAPHTPTLGLARLRAAKIQNDLRILTERLARINDNLARKISSRNEYDKTIQETEAAYSKVRGGRYSQGESMPWLAADGRSRVAGHALPW